MFYIFILLIILIICSAVISSLETAITASSLQKINKKFLKKNNFNNSKKIYAIAMLKNKHEIISSLLIANNILNIFVTTLFTSLFFDLFGKTLWAAIAIVIMSIVFIFFAEIIPKMLTVNKAENVFLKFIHLIRGVIFIFKPISKILNVVGCFFQKLLQFKYKNNLLQKEKKRILSVKILANNKKPFSKKNNFY
ncbi:MAG: DUF21 domain-containing protein [Rickettsia sp.]|nr:DUF21 domain-containing protein [Rickettsia sp.]